MTEVKKSPGPLSKIDMGIAVFVWLLAFSLYIRTLAPSLLWDDSAEYQTLSYTLGVTHGTGYMTYIMIGNLFTKIPLGSVAYRVNLASAFFGALAAAQVFLIVRVLGNRQPAAFAASALLVLMRRFWTLSIIAELYAPAAAIIAAIWLLVLLWNRTEKWEYLFAAGMLGGLSLGIHNTIMMTAASVLIYMAISARTRSAWLAAATGALLGAALTLAAFLYLDANNPPSSFYNTVYLPSLGSVGSTPKNLDTPFERLYSTLPATSFLSYYFTAQQKVISARLAESVGLFPSWAIALLFIGMITSFFRARWYDGLYPLISFLLIWGLGVTIALSSYRDFYAPAAVMAVVWIGTGASIVLDGVEKIAQQIPDRRKILRTGIMTAAALTFILLPLFNSQTDIRMAVEKGHTDFIRRNHVYPIFTPEKSVQDSRKVLSLVETNAIIFTNWNRLYSLIYTANLVENRKDIIFREANTAENQYLDDAYIKYIDANIDSRPIYFMVILDNVRDHYQVERIGNSLFRIYRK